jgi:hypothetical protein
MGHPWIGAGVEAGVVVVVRAFVRPHPCADGASRMHGAPLDGWHTHGSEAVCPLTL